MKSLMYIVYKSIKNGIIELKRKPGKLILYCIFIIFLAFALIVGLKEQKGTNILSSTLYGNIVSVLILLFTVPELLSSLNNGGTFFRGADINFVFSAPISPQKVLLYGFIKQIYNSFIALFFLLFQIPNLYRFNNIKPYGIFVIILGLFMLLIVNSVIKILIYSISSINEKNKTLIKNIFIFLGTLMVLSYFVNLYTFKSPAKAITFLLNHKAIEYIPIYGWIRNILMVAITGVTFSTYSYIILLIAFCILCIYILYSMKLDYYEDVITSTEIRETAIEASRKGEKVQYNIGKKVKVRKVEYKRKGHGASAIFWRHILENKKRSFAFLNLTSILYIILSITMGSFLPIKDLRFVIGVMIYLQLIFTFASKWQQELSNPYIYMIPDSSFKKVVYSTALDNIKNLIDGSLVFFIAGIMFKSSIILIILNIIAFAAVGSLFIYGGVLTRRVLGNGENIVITSFMRIGLLILVILPGVIIFAVANAFNNTFFGEIFSYIIFIGYNLLCSIVIILLSQGIFENIEL